MINCFLLVSLSETSFGSSLLILSGHCGWVSLMYWTYCLSASPDSLDSSVVSVEILQRTLPRGPVPDASLRIGRICDVLVVSVALTACGSHFSFGPFGAID